MVLPSPVRGVQVLHPEQCDLARPSSWSSRAKTQTPTNSNPPAPYAVNGVFDSAVANRTQPSTGVEGMEGGGGGFHTHDIDLVSLNVSTSLLRQPCQIAAVSIHTNSCDVSRQMPCGDFVHVTCGIGCWSPLPGSILKCLFKRQ